MVELGKTIYCTVYFIRRVELVLLAFVRVVPVSTSLIDFPQLYTEPGSWFPVTTHTVGHHGHHLSC